jgi:hypothetical protein
MKQKVGALIGFVFLALVVGVVIVAVRARTPKQGELKVDSDPVTSAFLDGKHIGRTPIGKPSYKVTSGEYELKLTPDSSDSTAVFQEKIKVNPGTLTYIDVKLGESDLVTSSYVLWLEKMTGSASEISVVTTPDSATVLLDDEPKGTSPLTIPDVVGGDHTLTVTSRGFVTKNMRIRASVGYRLIASVKLALGGGAPEQTASPSATPGPTPKTSPGGSPKPTPTKSTSAEPTKPYALIKDTPTGFLRVRTDASTTSAELTRVKPGEKYTIVDAKDEWYKIQYEATRSGWISSTYVEKVE